MRVDGRGEVDGAELLERSALLFMPNNSLNSPEKLAADTTVASAVAGDRAAPAGALSSS
jgi:hypothetical protein